MQVVSFFLRRSLLGKPVPKQVFSYEELHRAGHKSWVHFANEEREQSTFLPCMTVLAAFGFVK